MRRSVVVSVIIDGRSVDGFYIMGRIKDCNEGRIS